MRDCACKWCRDNISAGVVFRLVVSMGSAASGTKMHRVALLAVRKPSGVLLALPAMSADTRFSELKHVVREQWSIPLSMQRSIVGQSEIWADDDDTFSTSFGIADDAEKDVVEVTVLRDVVSEELDAAARAAGMSTELAFHLQRRRVHVVFFDSLFYSVGFSTHIELERALLLIPHDCRDWFMLFDDDSTLRCQSTDFDGVPRFSTHESAQFLASQYATPDWVG